jgi:predicted dehydrogenase
MRFFQPRDYIVIDYATNHASISNLAPSTRSPWPGVQTRILEVKDVEPLRAEIESFIEAARCGSRPVVSGEDGRRALSLALRTLEEIHQHTIKVGADSLFQKA